MVDPRAPHDAIRAHRQPVLSGPTCDRGEGWSCDDQSFSEIYERHGDAVFAVATRVGFPHLAADVTQETFLRLWQHPDRFDPRRGSLRAFLVVAAKGFAIDRARSEYARSARELRAGPPVRAPADLAAGLLEAEAVDEITAALRRLAPDCRDAIVIAFYGGLTYAEVALQLGAAEGTVKTRIRRGLLQLRRDLAGEEHR